MAINGIQPTVAGVFGIKDYTNLLNQSNGMGKLIGTALDMYKFKSGQAQQNEMQQAAQEFNAAEAEKNRQHQVALDNARWDRDQELMARQEALQAKKELAGFQADANPIISMNIDERNKGAVMDKANRLQQVIAKAKNIGDADTLAATTQEYNRLMGMYAKDSGGQRTGGVLQDIEEQEAAQAEAQAAAAEKERAYKRWEALNNSGNVDAAWNYMYQNSKMFSPEDVAQMQSLMEAQYRKNRGDYRGFVTAEQGFADDQKKRGRKKLK